MYFAKSSNKKKNIAIVEILIKYVHGSKSNAGKPSTLITYKLLAKFIQKSFAIRYIKIITIRWIKKTSKTEKKMKRKKNTF